MTDRDDISSLVHRYADAVANSDAERWRATWASGAVWDVGRGRRVVGLDAVVALWRTMMERFESVVQTVQSGTVDVQGDEATGRWHIHEAVRRSNGKNELLFGHYDDTYSRVDGAWYFASRRLVVHYQGPTDLSGSSASRERS